MNKLLFAEAEENGWKAYEIFDNDEFLMQIGEIIYDFKKDTWNSRVDEFYDIFDSNLLILRRMEILPQYRKSQIGKHVIKDIYNNFIHGAGLFVLKCFPMQQEADMLDSNEFNAAMKFDELEKDYKKSFHKLIAHYKKFGFEQIPGLNEEIMFINPALINTKLNKIVLD